ncbi:hypothetical protein BC835DRAFT_1422063 [Cytidiella melzeri]|nr:hypothetical protein BC835DRAFT_1422063 [Cytidiella melzeri]
MGPRSPEIVVLSLLWTQASPIPLFKAVVVTSSHSSLSLSALFLLLMVTFLPSLLMVTFVCQTSVRLLNHAYLRITLSRVTASFFLLTFVFCVAQGLIQAFLWTDDNSTLGDINGVLNLEGVPTYLLHWLNTEKGGHYNLKVCSEAPYGAKNVSQVCPTVFDTGDTPDSSWSPPPGFQRNANNGNGSVQVNIAGVDTAMLLTEQCMYTLLYPAQSLGQSMDEELALIFSQFWLLGLSSAAVLSQSVSHIIAVFAMRVLSTGWSAYTIWRTNELENRLYHLVAGPNTPCHSDFEVLPDYFKTRRAFQIPDLILNVCALFFTAMLGYRLFKTFCENVFNCVGPPAKIVVLYRYMLTVAVSGQLLLYLMISSISLALLEGVISKAKLLALDVTLFVFSVILTVTMVVLGHYATRYERKRLMIAFLLILACFITGFLAMFIDGAFRFTWLQWPFFACVSGINAVVLIICAMFAVLCRIHFGEGLSHYRKISLSKVHVKQVLSDQDFEPDEFSTDAEDVKVTSATRTTFSVQGAMPFTPVVTRNTNWDFVDQTRPPIYTVEGLRS